jgi:hypothetical protein
MTKKDNPDYGSGSSIERLKPEDAEYTDVKVNPTIKLCADLLSGPFSAAKWRNYTVGSALIEISSAIVESGIPGNERHLKLLLKKFKRAGNMTDILVILSNGMLGEMHD